jgi:hypothetical protein
MKESSLVTAVCIPWNCSKSAVQRVMLLLHIVLLPNLLEAILLLQFNCMHCLLLFLCSDLCKSPRDVFPVVNADVLLHPSSCQWCRHLKEYLHTGCSRRRPQALSLFGRLSLYLQYVLRCLLVQYWQTFLVNMLLIVKWVICEPNAYCIHHLQYSARMFKLECEPTSVKYAHSSSAMYN